MRQQQDLVQQQVAVECGDFILKTHLDLKCELKVVFCFWKPFYSYYRYIKLIVIFLSPLNPKIKIWILICCPYSFPTSLQLSDKMSSKFILCDHVCNSHDHSVLQSIDITRKILCWSLLGLKELEVTWFEKRSLNNPTIITWMGGRSHYKFYGEGVWTSWFKIMFTANVKIQHFIVSGGSRTRGVPPPPPLIFRPN